MKGTMMKELSKGKIALAQKTTESFVSVINGSVTKKMEDALTELFSSLQSKSLERLCGILAGVSTGDVEDT